MCRLSDERYEYIKKEVVHLFDVMASIVYQSMALNLLINLAFGLFHILPQEQ